jgi:hypothetical protein
MSEVEREVTEVPATETALKPWVLEVPPGVAAGRAWLMPPQSFAEAMQIAELLAKSSFVPKAYREKPGDVLCAIQFGGEIGLPPLQALQTIAVIGGRPAVWGDGALGLVEASGLLVQKREWLEGEGDSQVASCEVLRRGKPEPIVRRFSVADAKRANLWGKKSADGIPSPWVLYPTRMLQMRARSWALRDEFPDVLRGLAIREDVDDIDTGAPIVRLPERRVPGIAEPTGDEPTTRTAQKTDPAAPEPAPPAATTATAADEPLCSDEERRTLLQRCHEHGKSFDALQAWLKAQGAASTTAIPRRLYDAACAWASAAPSGRGAA